MHVGNFERFPFDMDKAKIEQTIRSIVARSGDGYGTNRIEFLPGKVFSTDEEAKDYILHIAGPDYWGYAVPYLDHEGQPTPKSVLLLLQKQRDLNEKACQIEESCAPYHRKSEYVGCPRCGSKLAREYLRIRKLTRCPLCQADMRTATAKLKKAQEIRAQAEAVNAEIAKAWAKEGGTKKWVVFFEYHS